MLHSGTYTYDALRSRNLYGPPPCTQAKWLTLPVPPRPLADFVPKPPNFQTSSVVVNNNNPPLLPLLLSPRAQLNPNESSLFLVYAKNPPPRPPHPMLTSLSLPLPYPHLGLLPTRESSHLHLRPCALFKILYFIF